jgi:UDP-N-acetylmuramoylalanine--D-glutamate ligase
MDFHGVRATVMGLGSFGGGAAAARWLARQGARVTATDLAEEAAMAATLATLHNESIEAFHLGGHREEDFRCADLVVVNPAVRPNNPLVEIASQSGARIASEIELFLEACPARILGVTGSNGKSTTAAMTAAILNTDGWRTWLGGNIGGSLLDRLEEIDRDDWAVLELSSFQLWHLSSDAAAPHVAVVTNCTPNHLDWHGSYEHYVAAKQRILTQQTDHGAAVLNTTDPELAKWRRLVRGECLEPLPLGDIPPLLVPGHHNRMNAASAAAAAIAAGCSTTAIQQALRTFCGLPQRLERLDSIEGRRFYNDSTATTPESAIAALRSLPGPLWLLAGGRSKGFDFGPLAAAIVQYAAGAAFFGAARHELQQAVAAQSPKFLSAATETLDNALQWCWQHSQPGNAIVLSPACASTDQFRNFRQRGERFVELVGALGNR